MFYTEVIIVFSLFWVIGAPILWYIIYRANLAAMNKHVENMEEEDEDCCAGEGYCECLPNDAPVNRYRGEIVEHTRLAHEARQYKACGYTPPKKEEK